METQITKYIASFVNDDVDNPEQENPKDLKLFKLMTYGLVAVLFVLGIDIILTFSGSASDLKTGMFGDFFGGVLNPILTFLMLFGLLITIYYQRSELRAATREFKKSSSALTTQTFESWLFSSLDLHHKITDSIEIDFDVLAEVFEKDINELMRQFQTDRRSSFKGRKAFRVVLECIREQSLDVVKVRYEHLNNFHNHIFGQYFRNLYQILKQLERADLSYQEKLKYSALIRAQLSSSELTLLFFNCMGDVVDQGQFRDLLVLFSMLEHMPKHGYNDGIEVGDLGIKINLNIFMSFQEFSSKALAEKYQDELNLVISGGAFGEASFLIRMEPPEDELEDGR